MTLYVIFALLALAILLFIAAEVYILVRELSRALTLLLKERETREGTASGQTINVNLGTVPTGTPPAPGTLQTVSGVTKTGPTDAEAEALAEAEKQARDRDTPAATPKASPSGPFAVKCPKCQSENSSYRSECFNCGERLN